MTNKSILDYLMERFDKYETKTEERFEKLEQKIDKLIEFKWRVVGVVCGIVFLISGLFKLADLFLKAAA